MQKTKTERNDLIHKLAKKGLTYTQIAKSMNVSKQRVHQIVKLSTDSKLDAVKMKEYNATRFIGS